MHQPKCIKCDNNEFRITEYEPIDSKFKINLIQCSKCNTIAGTLDFINAGYLIENQQEILEEHSKLLNSINNKLDILTRNLKK